MNSAVTELTRSITGKHSLDACSVDELEQLTLQYPYFGPAQFLLARKLKEENSPLYGQQSQKALLYFRDPLWFDYVCSDNSQTQIITIKKEERQEKATGTAQPEEKTIEPIGSDQLHPAAVALPEQPQEIVVPGPWGLTMESEGTIPGGIPAPEAMPEPLPEEKQINPLGSDELHPATAEPLPEQSHEVVVSGPWGLTIESQETIPGTPVSVPEEKQTDPSGSGELHPATAEPLSEQPHEVVVSGPWGLTIESQETIPGTPVSVPEEKQTDPSGSDGLHPALEESLPATSPETTPAPELPRLVLEPMPAEETALVFEPYHTVDYFASQGIRPKEEEKPRDRFSQQLKSFTEWLKTMKRLPAATPEPAASQDKNIEQMAEHSLADREIVTEAMASVWEQQGNPDKAIAIYRKLSLLNPSKSAYFAAKIEHLKHP